MIRLEKLSLKCKIDVFSPQARDSRTMHESWQAYHPHILRLSVEIKLDIPTYWISACYHSSALVVTTRNFGKNNIIRLSLSVEFQFRLICVTTRPIEADD